MTATQERTSAAVAVPADKVAAAPGRKRAIGLAVVAAVAVGGVSYWLYDRQFEETDDAQIDANISNISSRVSGTVTGVYVVENQRVKAGDLLADIDPRDLQVTVDLQKAQVAEAEAQLKVEDPSVFITEMTNKTTVAPSGSDLASAQAALSQARKSVDQLAAQLTQAKANDKNAQLEKQRADQLIKQGAITQSESDQKTAAADASAANVDALQQALEAARAGVGEQEARMSSTQSRLAEARANAPKQLETRRASVIWRQAALDAAKAQQAQAELNLSYTKLASPVSGIVGKKAIAVGDHVAPGQELMAVVQTDAVWVTANYRETQLRKMHPGLGATIHVDAIDANLHGTVESIGGATGSRYSVLPPENASGNYVKVVQRIPVRIKLDPGQTGMDRLRPGMSVEPKVRLTAAALPPQERPAYFTTGWTGGHNPWAVALVVTMATFMEVLDTSIANVSLPHIAGNLSVSQDESTWVLTSYLVSNAIVLPISGWIASKIGRKRFYMTCVALFTVSSFLCGIAPSLGALIFFRVLQGLGGGGLGPSEQSILADTFPPAKRGMAFAVYGMAVVLAPAIGPTLGGFITDHYNWRWVFFINVPVGLASLLLSNHFVTDPPHLKLMKEKSGGIDYIGLSLIALGLGTLEVVLDKGQEADWFHSAFILWFSIIAAISLITFVVWEWHQKHPVVNVRMFKSRNFAVSNIMMMTLGISLFGTTVLLPQYMQTLMGYSAQDAGMALSPGGFAVILLLPAVGFMVSRVDPRRLIGFGFLVMSLSLYYMTTHLYQGIDFKTATFLRVYQSIGLAFLFVPINTLVYAGVPLEKNNSVSGIVNLSRNMGGDIGIAFVTTFIARRSQMHQSYLSAHTTHYSAPFEARLQGIAAAIQHTGASALEATQKATAALYGQLVQNAVTLAYLDALRVMAVATALMVPLLLLTERPKPGGAPGGH